MAAAIWVAVIGGLFSIITIFYKNWNQACSINIGIVAELQRLIENIEEHASWWEKCVNQGDTQFPLIPFATPVFDEHEKDLGQVSTKIVAKAVKFYGALKFVNALQSERPNYIAAGKGEAFDKQYLRVLKGMVRDYKGAFDGSL